MCILHNPQNNLIWQVLSVATFYRWENWDFERLAILLNVTQLVSGKYRFQTCSKLQKLTLYDWIIHSAICPYIHTFPLWTQSCNPHCYQTRNIGQVMTVNPQPKNTSQLCFCFVLCFFIVCFSLNEWEALKTVFHNLCLSQSLWWLCENAYLGQRVEDS